LRDSAGALAVAAIEIDAAPAVVSLPGFIIGLKDDIAIETCNVLPPFAATKFES
jgi:hypothetical protein